MANSDLPKERVKDLGSDETNFKICGLWDNETADLTVVLQKEASSY